MDHAGDALWTVVPGYHQLRHLHHVWLQLLQAAIQARLALIRCIQRIPGRIVHRDVWLPAYHLSSVGWLQSRFPNVDWVSHNSGHLLEMLFGWRVNPHFGPFHLLSYGFIGGGFMMIAAGWNILYPAQRDGRLAETGIYARMRHPQYDGFVLVMFGFLLQWPTILTLVMFPVLVFMYWRLAKIEERESMATFGQSYREYMWLVPAFFPHLRDAEVSKAAGQR